MKDLQFETFDPAEAVYTESWRQVEKWGIQDRDSFEWLGFATEELGECANAISEHRWRGGSPEAVAKEAIQTATLCLKIAEMYLALAEGNKLK